MCFPSRLRSSATLTSLPSLRRCLPTWGERLSSRDAGGSRASKRARPREIRISPRSSQPQEHAAHAFEPSLSHPAASPRVHRSNLLYALARCSSSARTQRLLRSCAPVPWSHATMLGGSDDFSLRCSRSCAEHYVGCSHFEARAPLCACGLCRVRSIRWSACGTLNARSRWSCGVSP